MDLDFLLTRGEDLAVLGVRMHGFQPPPQAAPGEAKRLTAGADAWISLFFPPQHIVEGAWVAPDTAHLFAPVGWVTSGELSGSSSVKFRVLPDAVVPLTSDGVLAACHQLSEDVASGATSIELPWRLAFRPVFPSGLVAQHADAPTKSANGTFGLWLTRILPPGSELPSAPAPSIDMTPVDASLAAGADPGFAVALDRNSRNQIVAFGQVKPPKASRLELTSLGGSISIDGSWDGFEWSQRTGLGRDQSVRVTEKGMLYPFGIPAVLTTISERSPGSINDASPGSPPGTGKVPEGWPLALRKTISLRVTDPIKRAPAGRTFGRSFPFDRVEITARSFTRLGKVTPAYTFHRSADTVQLKADRDELARVNRDELQPIWGPEARGNRTLDDLLNDPRTSGWAQRSVDIGNALASYGAEIGPLAEAVGRLNSLMAALAEAERRLSLAIAGSLASEDGSVSGAVQAAQEQVDSIQSQINELGPVDFNRLALLNAEIARLNAESQQLLNLLLPFYRQPRGPEDVASGATEAAASASQWLANRDEIARLDARITQLNRLASTHDVFFWIDTPTGERLKFPVRLGRGNQALDVTMPLIFIKDFTLPPQNVLPEYRSLSDPELASELDKAWTGPEGSDIPGPRFVDAALPPSVVQVPGTLFDVVGAAVPKPSDKQVIHGLNIVAGSLNDLFSPSFGRLAQGVQNEIGYARAHWSMLVHLPELQALRGPAAAIADGVGVPNVTTSALVGFAEDYLSHGEDAKALFKSLDGIAADFTKAADRSGGLSAMAMVADGISREHGVVQLAGLVENPDPKQMIDAAATLLGFPLQSLLGKVPQPPKIVSELLEGKTPVVRMEWRKVPLKSEIGFVTYPNERDAGRNSLMDLTVVSQVDKVTISSEVRDFSLVFPFGGSPLVRLDFDKLKYEQITERLTANPPKIQVDGFDFTFEGPLELLKALQNAVDLFGKVPGIKATPKGVTASFSLPVPDVACGVFSLSNLVFRSNVDVPFDGKPVSVTIAFASRSSPFLVSVLSFSGGGYVEIYVDANGPRIEASLEFGARLAVNFLVATGQVYALGGIRYVQNAGAVDISGYLRIGGSLEILKIVSVSVEIVILLSYQSSNQRLVGRATLVLEIDLTLWSDSIEIDTGEWILQGGSSPRIGAAPQSAADRPISTDQQPLEAEALALAAIDAELSNEALAAWRAHRAAFTGASA